MKNQMSRTFIWICLCLLLSAGGSRAVDFLNDDQIHITNLHTINDDIYAWGENVTIDGTIEGDAVLGGYRVITNGDIHYSSSIFAYECMINGYIDGSLRTFAYSTTVNGHIGRSALISSAMPRVEEKAVIEGDLILYGGDIVINGTVNGICRIQGEKVRITGNLNNDVFIEADHITIASPAFIKGDLNYVSSNQAQIDVQSGATVLGNTTWDLPEEIAPTDTKGFFTICIIEAGRLLAAFLFGVIIFAIARKYVVETVFQLKTKPALSLGVGVATISIFLVSIIILLLSLVMLIAGGILISDNHSVLGAFVLAIATLLIPITSFAAVSGGILFYAGKIMIALLAGFFLANMIYKNVVQISRKQLLLGLVLLAILFNIPYLGALAYIVLSIVGAGGIVLGIRHCRHDIDKLAGNNT